MLISLAEVGQWPSSASHPAAKSHSKGTVEIRILESQSFLLRQVGKTSQGKLPVLKTQRSSFFAVSSCIMLLGPQAMVN